MTKNSFWLTSSFLGSLYVLFLCMQRKKQNELMGIEKNVLGKYNGEVIFPTSERARKLAWEITGPGRRMAVGSPS